jgi:hypothetical protein
LSEVNWKRVLSWSEEAVPEESGFDLQKPIVPPNKVKHEMIGKDYNGTQGIVLRIFPAGEWFDHMSQGAWNDIKESVEIGKDWIVLVQGFDYGPAHDEVGETYFVYGPEGFAVYK